MTTLKLSELLGYSGRIRPLSYPLSGGYLHAQTSSSTTWTVNHNLNSKYVSVQVINSDDQVIDGRYDYPTITFVDENTLTIGFTYSLTGYAVITTGTGSGDTTLDGNVYFGSVGSVGTIQDTNGVDLYANVDSRWAQLNYNNWNFVAATSNGIEIDTYTGSGPTAWTWLFSNTGQFAMPANSTIAFGDSTVQSTAYPGLQSVPANAKGKAGDLAGMFAVSSQYLYYCSGTYNGSTNIWHRIANDNNNSWTN